MVGVLPPPPMAAAKEQHNSERTAGVEDSPGATRWLWMEAERSYELATVDGARHDFFDRQMT